MGWQETRFERENLYAEVWAEPVRVVAARHGLSDVGLRKISTKLGVPVPPLGYWARVAAGRRPPTRPLSSRHDGAQFHIYRKYVDDEAGERTRLAQRLLSQNRPQCWPTISLP